MYSCGQHKTEEYNVGFPAEEAAERARAEQKKIFTSAKANLQVVLRAMNLPMEKDENFRNTSARWLKYIRSYTQPYDDRQDLETTFPLAHKRDDIYDRSIVVQVGIPYRAVCAHHLLPVLGTAHVGYLPKERVVGLSKLTRLVHGITHRMPSLQEDVCNEITYALMHHLKPEGAMCVISAEHGCMAARGVAESSIKTVTASVKGIFQTNTDAREEFYRLIERGT